MDKNAVKVNIYGSEYMVKGDLNADHVKKIAEFVDQKMREINKSGTIKSSLKVAILAALNIADEYFKTQDDQRKLMEDYEFRIQKLIDTLKKNSNSTSMSLPSETTKVKTDVQEISLFSQE